MKPGEINRQPGIYSALGDLILCEFMRSIGLKTTSWANQGFISVIIAMLLLGNGVAAAEPASASPEIGLAVAEITARRGADPELATVIEDYLVERIAREGGYRVIGRDDILRLLDHEERKRLLDCREESCLAQIGGALGVNRLVTGSLDLVGEATLLTLKMINVQDGTVLSRCSKRLRSASEEDILAAVGELVERVFQVQDLRGLPRLAVTEFRARKGVDPELARIIEEYLVVQVARSKQFDVIGRDDIVRMLQFEDF